MVKLFTTEHTFQHPFERVTSAFWRKYPNDAAAHVKAIDITDRRIDEQGQSSEGMRGEGDGGSAALFTPMSLPLCSSCAHVDPPLLFRPSPSYHVSPGRLITNRIMSCESALPSWCRAAGLPQSCFVAECSVVDPKSREMLVKSSNLSGASLMVIEETCRYTASPAAPTKATLYKQEAKITAFLPFLAGKVRGVGVAWRGMRAA